MYTLYSNLNLMLQNTCICILNTLQLFLYCSVKPLQMTFAQHKTSLQYIQLKTLEVYIEPLCNKFSATAFVMK